MYYYRLASCAIRTQYTTDTRGLKFRNYHVSWDNDVLRCFYQGREVLTMCDLSRYFSTPTGQLFMPIVTPVPNQVGVNPMEPVASAMVTPMSASMMAPAFMITDIFATSELEPDIIPDWCVKLCFGNMQTSKWGLKTIR